MSCLASHHQTAPYPALPGELAAHPSAEAWRLRRFGVLGEDLQVDLTADPPTAITNLLACCTEPQPDSEMLWNLTVGKRIECLLILAELDGREAIDLALLCPQCRAPFEVTLVTRELLEAGRAADRTVIEVKNEARVWLFRLPTGRDQRRWLEQTYPSQAAAVDDLIATLALDGLADAPVTALDSALDEADPLVRTSTTAACPDCGCVAEGEADLAGMLLEQFRRAQDSIIGHVDLLASRYHWSEAEILRLPSWRRERYANRLQQERR